MAQIAEPRRSPGSPARPTDARSSAVGGTLVAVALVVSVGDPGRIAWVRTFFVIFGSLLIQALPFVLLGALAAALVEVFVPIGCVREARRPPAAAAAPRGRAGGARVPDLRVRVGAGRATADAARADALGRGDVHARRAGAEPRRDRLDVRRVPGQDHAVDDGRRPLPPRDARRDRRGVGDRQPLEGRAAQAEPRGGGRAPARARTSRGAMAALLRAPGQRLPVHGPLPAARRDDRGGDPDVPARRRC